MELIMPHGDASREAQRRWFDERRAGEERVMAPTLGIQNMAIVDGQGGVLTVDLGSPDAHALRDACRLLLPHRRMGWAGAIKVRVGERTYLLRKRQHEDEDKEIRIDIADLYDPCQRVSLTSDLVRLMIGVLDGVTGAAGTSGAAARSW
jgi:hypothetical protein